MDVDDAVQEDVLGEFVTAIQIEGAYKGFEGVAAHRLEVGMGVVGVVDHLLKTKFL